jgi:hypothetical protein
MFAARYFAGRYFPRRYFPAVGADLISVVRRIALTGYVRSNLSFSGFNRAIISMVGYLRKTFNFDGFLK